MYPVAPTLARSAVTGLAMICSTVRGPNHSAGPKRWLVGPWNSNVPVAVGWADKGVDDPHRHDEMNEIYLVARGTSQAQVGAHTVELQAGDVLVVEPGEEHTFNWSSEDYLHFVVQAPFVVGDKVAGSRRRPKA
jgi:mannose-6-phosphate isomerase-like protein (cupin superfamily)